MDVESLSEVLSEVDFSCVEDEGEWYLTAASFQSLADAGDVLNAAREVVELINGGMRLHFGDHENIAVASTAIKVGPGGNKNIHEVVGTAHIQLRGMRLTAKGTVGGTHAPPETHPVLKWLRFAESDPVATEILWFLSRDPDWFVIYKLHELLMEHGGMAWAIHGGHATKAELNRLTGTANSFSAVGRAARHAKLDPRPMKNPMALEEATRLIRCLARKWFDDRC